jgi:hypothetical protein
VVALVCAAFMLVPAAQAKQWLAGVVPDVAASDVPTGNNALAMPWAGIANLSYQGGPVLHSNRTHVVFWQPAGSGLTFDRGYEALVTRFLKDVAADSHRTTNVYSISGQYRDGRGPAAYASRFGGAVVARDRLPRRNSCAEPSTAPHWTHCVDDQQIENEIGRAVRTHRSARDIYFLLTPRGLGSCEFRGPDNCALGATAPGGYCGYHSSTPDGLLYAVLPYNAVAGHCQSENARPNGNAADPTISTLSHEHNETVTDPFGTAWIDGNSEEEADLCLTDFGHPLGGSGDGTYDEAINHHHYYLQEEWSNRQRSCQPRVWPIHASIAARKRARAGTPIRFTGRASDPNARITSYTWFFGDHHTGHGRRPKHAFSRPGVYRVVLRTSDHDALWAFAARKLRIRR